MACYLKNDKKIEIFLEEIRKTGNITHAAACANLDRKALYVKKKIDPEFCKAWEEALELGIDRLEDACMERAVFGVPDPVFYNGEIIYEKRVFNDSLAMFLLKKRKPHVYRDTHELWHANLSNLTDDEISEKIKEILFDKSTDSSESKED